MTRMMLSALVLLFASCCALGPQFVPAAAEPPEPAYDPVGSASADAWDVTRGNMSSHHELRQDG